MFAVHFHLVRFGALGWIGRFGSSESLRYPPGQRVICQTIRGLEVGDVLNDQVTDTSLAVCGEILRPMARTDLLLQSRLNKNRRQAIETCSRMLSERRLPGLLLDAEQTFDGENLFFYFLGDVPPEVERLTAELAETYEANVQMRKFSELLTHGCGPGCGGEAARCGSNGCSSCGLAGGCGTQPAN
jgi:cell fate regulator YaaT (PSP1 superfamily)